MLQAQPLALTPREQALLTVLMYRRTRPVSRQQLFEQVFSLSDEVSPESIELYIHRLRKNYRAVTCGSPPCVGWVTCWSAAMRWAKPQSLYLQLLLFLGLPLVLLWGLSAFNSYVSALQAATQAYDRTLLSSARTVAERLVVRHDKLR